MIKRFFISTSNYMFARIVFALSGLLIAPILTRLLAPDELGLVYLITGLVTLVSSILLCGGAATVQAELIKSDEANGYAVSHSIALTLLAAFIFTIVAVIFFGVYGKDIDGIGLGGLVICIATAVCYSLRDIAYSVVQVLEQSRLYLITIFLSSFIAVAVTIILLLRGDAVWLDRVIGLFIGSLVSILISCYWIFRKFPITCIKFSRVYRLMIIGLPVLLHSISMLAVNQTDKYTLAYFLGNEAVGVYAVQSQLAATVSIVASAIAMAFTPMLYKALKAPLETSMDDLFSFRRKLILLIAGFGVFLWILLYIFGQWFVGDRIQFDHGLSFQLVTAYTVFSMMHLYSSTMYYFNNSSKLMIGSFSISLINIILAISLVPKFGVYGASVSTLISYSLGVLYFIFISNIKIRSYISSVSEAS